MLRLTLGVLFSVFVGTVTAIAQTGTWRNFSNSTTPTCMAKDGPYLWIGTHGGLVKFDTRTNTFIKYTTDNGLPQNWIARVARAKDGAIWAILPGAGVARLASGKWTSFTSTNSALPFDNGPDIAADSLGRVWAATGNGLAKFEHGKWTTYNTSNSPLRSNSIYGVACDKQGHVWVVANWTSDTAPQLFKFDGNATWEQHSRSTDSGYACDNAFSMMVASDSSLWIGMEGYVAHVKNGHWSKWAALPSANGPSYNYVFGLAEDSIGGVWATDAYGIAYYDGSQWHQRSHNDTTSTGHYPFERGRGIAIDGSTLWVTGYEAEGLARLQGTTWSTVPNLSDNPMATNFPQAMTVDPHGNLWVGLRDYGGLYKFDGTSWSSYDTLLLGRNDMVMALAADSAGNIWFGSDVGVTKFDGVQTTKYDMHAVDSFSNVIYSLMWDERRHQLWVGNGWEGSSGHRSGIAMFDGTNWKTWSYPVVFAQIMALAEDSYEHVWAISFDEGIYGYQLGEGNGGWTFFNSSNSVLPASLNLNQPLAADNNGGVWTVTDQGPAYWNGSSWRMMTSSKLPSGADACTIDTKGRVWVGGFNGGASVFDGSNWNAFTPSNSGIPSAMICSAVADSKGNVWFGTNGQGLIEFIPDATSDVKQPSQAQVFSCYPNPANTFVTIEGASEKNLVQLFDMLGREVKRVTPVAGKAQIETNDLVSGHYIISSNGTSLPIEILH